MDLFIEALPAAAQHNCALPATLDTIVIEPSLSRCDATPLAVVQLLSSLPAIRCVLTIKCHFTQTDAAQHLPYALNLRARFENEDQLAVFRASGRFRIDWQLPQVGV